MSPGAPPPASLEAHSLEAALDLLTSPARCEALSAVMGGPGALVIELAMPDEPPSGERLEAARRALAELP